ncbi:Mandelate racemase / muconate lactonizing enzyme, C-terminal domain [Hoeflea sp. IMCC20628]|uniref:enolase C-terminal domain-like protein n=1 Tax=Hoeflea sp. IMCC20628 TaxID=1620421 RepID=UPI00063AD89A|nr:enolase C-terminal domain-like protein [Hoeflea sp. IMCC20628]AKH99680.1 Mandelate racemase / muconate lactonizing enzyme, C-terminal domain [Hoeflea sp. IMCC20628]
MARFVGEAAKIKVMAFVATKVKLGLGAKDEAKLAAAVRRGVGDDSHFIAAANHCYTTADAYYVGRALEELDAFWFEEPIAPNAMSGPCFKPGSRGGSGLLFTLFRCRSDGIHGKETLYQLAAFECMDGAASIDALATFELNRNFAIAVRQWSK